MENFYALEEYFQNLLSYPVDCPTHPLNNWTTEAKVERDNMESSFLSKEETQWQGQVLTPWTFNLNFDAPNHNITINLHVWMHFMYVGMVNEVFSLYSSHRIII